MACLVYKLFRKLRRISRVKVDKPAYRKDVIMLNDILFIFNLEK